jgi:hypothetical protein
MSATWWESSQLEGIENKNVCENMLMVLLITIVDVVIKNVSKRRLGMMARSETDCGSYSSSAIIELYTTSNQ